MRGRTTVGATLFTVLAGYAEKLEAAGGRIYVTGLEPTLIEQAERNGTITKGGVVRLYEATSVIGESSLEAYHDAQEWVARKRPDTTG